MIGLAALRRPAPRALYVADLGVSSLSNFMVLLVAAHVGGRNEFGAASVGIGLVTLAITLRQAAIGDLVVVRSATAVDSRVIGHAYTVSFAWGAVAALCTVGAVHAVGGVHAGFDLVLLAAPLLCVQDASRYVAFAMGRPGVALATDGLWLVLQSTALAGLWMWGSVSVTGATAAWVAGGAVSGLCAVVLLRIRPRLRGTGRWIRTERAFIGAAATQTLTSAGTTAALVYGVGVLASAAAAGAIRGVQTLLGPLNVLLVAERLRLTRHYTRVPHEAGVDREGQRTRSFVSLSVLAYLIALVACPRSLGTAALGATWLPARALLIPMAIQVLFLGLVQVPTAVFTARVQLRRAMALRAVLGASTVICSLCNLLWLPPAQAVAWGLATSSGICLAFGQWLLHREYRATDDSRTTKDGPFAYARGGGPYTQLISQRMGSVIASAAARARLTPDALTTANLVLGVGSSALFLLPSVNVLVVVAATIGWQLAYACDCADGQLARWKGHGSRHGKAYDVMCDFVVQVTFVTVVLAHAGVRSLYVAIPTAALFLLGTYFATVAEEYLPKRTGPISRGSTRLADVAVLQAISACRDYGLVTLVCGATTLVAPRFSITVLMVAATLNALTALLRFAPMLTFREETRMTPDNIVILAAGLGSRLGPASIPKPLAALPDGQTILGRQLATLAEYFPAARVHIVVGHMRELVMDSAPAATFVHNADYATTNTSASLRLALQQASPGSVLWLNGDVVFDPAVIRQVSNAAHGKHGSVCVVRKETGDEEVKFVASDDGHIRRISKKIDGGEGEAVGINFLTAAGRSLVVEALGHCRPGDYFEAALDALAEDGSLQLRTTDVTASFCMEIDTPSDLAAALTYFSGHSTVAAQEPTAADPKSVPATDLAFQLR